MQSFGFTLPILCFLIRLIALFFFCFFFLFTSGLNIRSLVFLFGCILASSTRGKRRARPSPASGSRSSQYHNYCVLFSSLLSWAIIVKLRAWGGREVCACLVT